MNLVPKIKTGDSNLDTIHASYLNSEIELNDVQNEILERLLVVWTLRHRHPSVKASFAIYQRKTGKERAQFFRDTRNANILFGNLIESDKKANKAIYEEMVKEWLERCQKNGDTDNAVKLLKMLGDSWDVAKVEDQLKFNPEKLVDKPIKIKIPKIVELRMSMQSNTGVMNFNKIIDAEAEIIEDEK
jgi:hypothetical protein